MNNKNELTGVIISTICVFIVLINRIACFVSYFVISEMESAILCLFSILMAMMTLWYCCLGYNKPHGNSLKVVFICFAVYIGHHASVDFAIKNYLVAGYSLLATSLIVAYVAGRLNKLEKNKRLLIVSTVLMLVDIVMHAISGGLYFTRIISLLSPIVLFVSISFAYTSRYKEHKEAGLNK